MNDNAAPDPRERMLTRLLTNTAAIESHLTKGLEAMLKANGCTPAFQLVMREFVSPALELMADLEKEVITFARKDQVKEKKRDLDLER